MRKMGKLREETTPKTGRVEGTKEAPKGGPSRVAAFFANLVRSDRYKPTQGKMARIWTASGLGLVLGAGLFTLYNYYLSELPILQRSLFPLGLALLAAWVVWRLVEYPPFVDFLIATEAEMTKVSWTTKDDLHRATLVVLTTVLILSLFLAGVDVVWSQMLKLIGVLKFGGGGAFGSQAG
jgi:preprotein translocase subunit SecE